MNFPDLTFPLTADFGAAEYWIGAQGPFRYGSAAAAFLSGEGLGPLPDGGSPLARELEQQLRTFGSHLLPYARAQDAAPPPCPETQPIRCPICFAFHPAEDGSAVMTERYVFSSLRDFLYVELGKAILRGSAPRQCRLCGGWFLHEHGSRAMYCGRIAPGEKGKTCREAGARAVFERKIQDEDTWKIYKRAYKKYYARRMKGNLSEEAFRAWAARAAADRDAAIAQMKPEADAALKAQIIERLRAELNRL